MFRYAPAQGDRAGWNKLAHECAQGAIFNSAERLPHSRCLPNTREGLLKDLKSLILDQRRKIVWLSGDSGSGKSTVAHTFAEELQRKDKLVATFFFSRKHTKRSTFNHFLLTIAYQLGLHHPRALEVIMKAISDDPALLSSQKSRNDQFEKLFIAPLQHLAMIWRGKIGMSLIVDALDEGTTSGTSHIEPFISILARLIRDETIPIHNIIISGRPWPQIQTVMLADHLADIMNVLRLDDYDSRQDVEHYMRHGFGRIYDAHDLSFLYPKPWPSFNDFTMLSERANGRFIFAATILRLVDRDQPHDHLALVCSMIRGSVEHAWGNIDFLYASIINSIDPSARSIGLRYLSLIVHLAEPLSLSDLHRFFGVNIYPHLLPFSALISIPSLSSSEVVQIYHSSLRDYLQKETNRVDVRSTQLHRPLATQSFRTMARLLKRDICGLGDPSLLHHEITDFAQKRDRGIPGALRYSCLHWLYHLQQADLDMTIRAQLLDFLEKRILYAIEVYGILGELVTGVNILRDARKLVATWSKDSFSGKDLALALLYDSWRLTLDFFDAINTSALHVYESALPTSPAMSQIRFTYAHVLAEATVFVFEEGLDEQWDCALRVVQLENVNDISAVSPDGSQAVIEVRDFLKVLDTATGCVIASLPTDNLDWPFRIHHNGSLVAITSPMPQTRVVHLWHPASGGMSSLALPPATSVVRGSAFSRDGHRLAIACFQSSSSLFGSVSSAISSNTTIEVYSTHSFQQISSFPLPSRDPSDAGSLTMDFSPSDHSLMVNANCDILILDPIDGRLHTQIRCEDQSGVSHFFSPDGDFVVHSRSGEGAINPLFLHEISDWSPPYQLTCRDGPSSANSPALNLEKIVYRGVQIAIKLGDDVNITTVPRGLPNDGLRTRWKSLSEECFGAIVAHDAIHIVDLAQAALLRNTPACTRPPPSGYQVVCRPTHMGGLKVFKANEEDRYIVCDTNTGIFVSEIIPEHPPSGPNLHFSATLAPRLSPTSAYFAVATSRLDHVFIDLWDPHLGAHIGQASTSCGYFNFVEIHFPVDETAVSLFLIPEGKIAIFSLEHDTITPLATLSDPLLSIPQTISSGLFCKIAKVSRDAVDWWRKEEDDTLTYHLRWSRATSEIVRMASFQLPKVHDVTHSPSFKRINCLTWDQKRFSMILKSEQLESSSMIVDDRTHMTYEVDEDNDPDAFFDSFSWSDLCIDKDGWLRKRRRRLCWLPERYRPSFLRGGNGLADLGGVLRLSVSGDKVKILDQDDDGIVTVRLPNTNVEYFDTII